jgi:hypothetical protein
LQFHKERRLSGELHRRARTVTSSARRGYGARVLLADMAEEARRRMAAGAYLRRHRIAEPTAIEADALQAEIDREVAAWSRPFESDYRSKPS